MSAFYKELDWPILDLELSKQLLEYSLSATNTGTMANYFYHHYNLPEYAEKFLRRILPIDQTYTLKIQRMFGVDRIPNHIDLVRNEVANFLLTPKGPSTCWYADDYSTVVESVVFDQYKWALLKTDVMHSVEGLTSDRIAISVFRRINPIREPGFWKK